MGKRKFLKSTISWLVYLAILAALIYGLPQILTFVLETEYPLASITSSSMWPTLKQGDLVLIKGVNKEELQVGDVVVYQNEMGFTIHRIVKMDGETLVTKGDANNINDSPVKYEQLIGRLVEVRSKPLRLPYLGMVSALVQKFKSS